MTKIKGYTAVSENKAETVNKNKELEEICLRRIDALMADNDTDKRCIAVAKTQLQDAFMWLNRGVFQPQRIELPEDA